VVALRVRAARAAGDVAQSVPPATVTPAAPARLRKVRRVIEFSGTGLLLGSMVVRRQGDTTLLLASEQHPSPDDGSAALCETARMDLDGYVWITTRKLKPGSREEFSNSWRPRDFPEGMLKAYELYSPDGNEVVGVSVWDSAESRDAYRRSEVESERRSAMAPYVLEEVSGFYVGRELTIPRD
jgi:heme-degrading monooxygenase HmoA